MASCVAKPRHSPVTPTFYALYAANLSTNSAQGLVGGAITQYIISGAIINQLTANSQPEAVGHEFVKRGGFEAVC